MNPKVEIFAEKKFKGKNTFYSEGTHEMKETFTQQELIGRTFYIILSQTKDGKKFALDKSGSDESAAKYHLWQWEKDNLNQIFTMLSNGTIKNVKNGLAMDVVGGEFKDGTLIQNYPQNNTEAQLWSYDSNTKMLKAKNKPFVLNLHNNEIKNDGKINIWSPNGHESQMWNIQLCEIKDNFNARERFALRFYNPVPSFNEKQEAYDSRFHNPVPSFTNDAHIPKTLQEQRETFTTCQAVLYEHIDGQGYNTGWVDIGDYGGSYFTSGKTGNGYAKNDDISSVSLKPFTDLFLYYDPDFKGKVVHIHNGTDITHHHNLTDDNFNDMVSSYKVRAGAMDGIWTINNTDTSGNAVCDIRYKVYSGGRWNNWTENGKQAGSIGSDITGFKFAYSGPGQLYMRQRGLNGVTTQWVSSEEEADMLSTICGFEFKVEGLKGMYIGMDVYTKEDGWISDVGLNKVYGSKTSNRPIQAVKLTVSLKEITATSTSGKTITLVDFPKNWTITDLSLGKFDSLIGKPFIIKSRKDNSFVIDTGGHQNGGGNIKIYKRSAEPHVNQVWTIDKYGRLTSWENRNSILYTPDTRNSTKPKMIGINENKTQADSTLAEWRLNSKNQICSIHQPNQVLDISGGTMKNDTPVIIYNSHNGDNQIWDIEEVKNEHDIGEFKKWVGKTFLIHCNECGDSSPLCIHSRNAQKGNGGDAGHNYITLWSNTNGNIANMIWTVNDKGQILLNDTKEWCIYASSTNNSTRLTLKKTSEIGTMDKGQFWSLDDKNRIRSGLNKNKAIDLSGGKDSCKDGGTLIVYDVHDGNNQKWIIKEYSTTQRNLVNDIGKFKDYVGKTIIIQPTADNTYYLHSRNVQKGNGGDAGGDKIGLWSANSNVINREWQVDTDGRILLSADKAWCVYASSPNNSTILTLTKVEKLNRFDMGQYWKFDGKSIISLNGTKKAMDVVEGKYYNGSTICVFDSDGRQNQSWTVKEVATGTTPNKSIGSIKVNPLTDVIVYEEELDKTKGTKRAEIHNGYRDKMYEIDDFSIMGLSTVRKIEVKPAKEDKQQTYTTTKYEPFKMFHKDGRISCDGMIIFTILIALCVFCFFIHFYMYDDEFSYNSRKFGQNRYKKINDWATMKGKSAF